MSIRDKKRDKSIVGYAMGALAIGVGKFLKPILILLKAFKFGKIGGSAITMGLMVWMYAQRYGFPFSAGFVVLILIHELGHGFAAWRAGCRVSAPVFIPFFGAFITLKDQPKTFQEQFTISAGGPIAGVLASMGCLFFSRFTPDYWSTMLLVLGHSGLTINLFNLCPVAFLDGSKMTSILAWPEWLFGLGLILFAEYIGSSSAQHINPIVTLLILFIVVRLVLTLFKDKKDVCASLEERFTTAVLYFTFTGCLVCLVERVWSFLPGLG